MKISAIYLVKNEEEFLERSVSTVIDQCHEVIIINQKSTDGTLDIARKLAERHKSIQVHDWQEDFDDICEYVARNKSKDLATGDWLLVLDADQLLSGRWLNYAAPLMRRPEIHAIGFRYEHYVGSYEHIHVSFYEKQKGIKEHPDVPLFETRLFRNVPTLECRPAMEVSNAFRKWHHASFTRGVQGRIVNMPHATIFHYGFSKRNMMELSKYRIHRGDYGHEPETKERFTRELVESNNPFKFIGPVHKVDYGAMAVPICMRPAFGKTYQLELDPAGFILSRTHIPTGVKC